MGNILSSPFRLAGDIPQGGVLSVTCFAVTINCIINEVSSPVCASLFVDDLAIHCTAYDAESACGYLQKSINSVCKWAKHNGFRFSTSRTVAVRFTRCKRQDVPNLELDGAILPYADEVEFLGMIFDSRLNWAKHTGNLKLKVKGSLSLSKVISEFDCGADKRSLLWIYDAICSSTLGYGCQIFSSVSKSKLDELNVVHNMGLRICSGAFQILLLKVFMLIHIIFHWICDASWIFIT